MFEASGVRTVSTGSIGDSRPVPMGSEPCGRCGGFMVADDVYGYEGDAVVEATPAWRCVNCGDMIDALIVANRRAGSRTVRIALRR